MDSEIELLKVLESLCGIDESDFAIIKNKLREERLLKKSYLFQEGDNYNKVAFVSRGLLKKFYITHEGKEFIKEFAAEFEIVAPYSSLLQDKRATFTVQALEDCLMLTLDWKIMKELFSKSLKWMNLGKKIAEMHFIRREQRESELLKLSAQDRYNIFKEQNAELVKRLKKQDIAAYLGINPVSFSRIIN